MSEYQSSGWGETVSEEGNGLDPSISDQELIGIAEAVARHVEIDGVPFEDRRQEVALKFSMNLDTIRNHAKPQALAWKIGKNHLKDIRRREQRFPEETISGLKVPAADEEDDRPLSVFEIASRLDAVANRRSAEFFRNEHLRLVFANLRSAMQNLRDRDREIIENLYGFHDEELSLAQVAEKTGLTTEYAGERKSKAIEKLRKVLALRKLLPSPAQNVRTTPRGALYRRRDLGEQN